MARLKHAHDTIAEAWLTVPTREMLGSFLDVEEMRVGLMSHVRSSKCQQPSKYTIFHACPGRLFIFPPTMYEPPFDTPDTDKVSSPTQGMKTKKK